MRSTLSLCAFLALTPAVGVAAFAAGPPAEYLVAEYFQSDPLYRADAVVEGAALDRLVHDRSRPAWPGDRPGSLTALYDSSLPAGLFGFELPRVLDESDTFSAAALFVIDPDALDADPNGFFQISWGLWNTQTTGLDRSGSLTSFAGDTFELLEFDYFPNVSPYFGGPYLSPSAFGVANPDDPSFPFFGSFSNATFALGVEVDLPRGVPLLAVIEHDPDLETAVVSVHEIVRPRRTVPVPGAVSVIDLGALGVREYAFDAVGLTLWNDGLGGPDPALRAKVAFHGFVTAGGLFPDVDAILRVPPRSR